MPLNKIERKQKRSILDESFNIQTLLQGSDSYKSLIYGIVTVVVLFVVIALGIKSLSQNKAQIDNEAVTTQNTTVKTPQGNLYAVVEGDTLWSIAQKSYNDGFSWHVIAKANNITDPSQLSSGANLIIPALSPTEQAAVIAQEGQSALLPATEMKPSTQMMIPDAFQGPKITGSVYTVVHGDNLWNIAVRAYGDGYRWTDIANINKLTNPGLIFSGNILNLPRP